MARLFTHGDESGDPSITFSSGSISSVSSPVNSGLSAFRVNPTSGTGFYRQQGFSGGVGFLRAYIRIATAPSANAVQVLRFSSSGNAHLASLRLDTDRTLGLFQANNSIRGSRSSALALNTWYYIELKLDGTTTTNAIEGKIDGTTFASGNNSGSTNWDRVLWGAVTPNATHDLYFDDIALNDDTTGGDNTFPGAIPPPSASPLQIKVAGTFGALVPQIKVAGTFGDATPHIKVGGVFT